MSSAIRLVVVCIALHVNVSNVKTDTDTSTTCVLLVKTFIASSVKSTSKVVRNAPHITVSFHRLVSVAPNQTVSIVTVTTHYASFVRTVTTWVMVHVISVRRTVSCVNLTLNATNVRQGHIYNRTGGVKWSRQDVLKLTVSIWERMWRCVRSVSMVTRWLRATVTRAVMRCIMYLLP